jgi:hypothetical protein
MAVVVLLVLPGAVEWRIGRRKQEVVWKAAGATAFSLASPRKEPRQLESCSLLQTSALVMLRKRCCGLGSREIASTSLRNITLGLPIQQNKHSESIPQNIAVTWLCIRSLGSITSHEDRPCNGYAAVQQTPTMLPQQLPPYLNAHPDRAS